MPTFTPALVGGAPMMGVKHAQSPCKISSRLGVRRVFPEFVENLGPAYRNTVNCLGACEAPPRKEDTESILPPRTVSKLP
jgi:hypothetical protein